MLCLYAREILLSNGRGYHQKLSQEECNTLKILFPFENQITSPGLRVDVCLFMGILFTDFSVSTILMIFLSCVNISLIFSSLNRLLTILLYSCRGILCDVSNESIALSFQ